MYNTFTKVCLKHWSVKLTSLSLLMSMFNVLLMCYWFNVLLMSICVLNIHVNIIQKLMYILQIIIFFLKKLYSKTLNFMFNMLHKFTNEQAIHIVKKDYLLYKYISKFLKYISLFIVFLHKDYQIWSLFILSLTWSFFSFSFNQKIKVTNSLIYKFVLVEFSEGYAAK